MEKSYFAKFRGSNGVSIALKNPSGFNGPSYPALFPKWSFLSQYFKDRDDAAYEKAYREQVLAQLDPSIVWEQLKDSVILCWEKSGTFCHRNIVADWLWCNLGVEVPEIDG